MLKKIMIKTTMDVIYGDENACRTTSEAIGVDTRGETVDVSGHGEDNGEYFDNWYAKTAHLPSDGVLPLLILPKSSHRDGSIYNRTHPWKEDYHIR